MIAQPLTEIQKESFESRFKDLINEETEAFYQWDEKFNWVEDIPKLDNIVKMFSKKGKDNYTKLMVKLKNRTL